MTPPSVKMDVSKMDGLDDFEKSLAADKAQREHDEGRRERKHKHRQHRDEERRSGRDKDRDREDREGHRHHRHRHNRDGGDDGGDGHRDEHRHKRSRREHESRDDEDRSERRRKAHQGEGGDAEGHDYKTRDAKKDLPLPDEELPQSRNAADTSKVSLERDAWMTAPSSLDVDYIHRQRDKAPPPSEEPQQRTVHARELNTHLNDEQFIDAKLAAARETSMATAGERKVNYTFGDAGSSWRMTKLRGVFAAAEDTGRAAKDIALERYGGLEEFDDAREEKEELERRKIYGAGYDSKEKPSGELYRERLRDIRKGQHAKSSALVEEIKQGAVAPAEEVPVTVDQTTLNRLRAQMMKAKLRRAPNIAQLEEEYNRAAAALASGSGPSASTSFLPGAVVVGAMENRLLAGQRGEVKAVGNRRGRERGNVEENEDMTIEDMVREERRTKGQAGGEALRQAERIAKDGKYADDLDYMDDNAAKLAKRVHKNEANLKNMAIGELQKLTRVLDSCPLCHHDGESGRPPVAPVVSLATRTFLTLPTEPEVSPGGAIVVPTTHRRNLLECDDDEWEEMRNFMKSLTRMYHAQGREVLFYENAAAPQQHRHAALVAVPIPYEEGAMAPAHFKEAFLSSDAEWSQHRPIIDTQKAADGGLGRVAFRRSIAKEMPYFHVWFTLDGGLGHVVEDGGGRWPKGDLFAREVIGGIVGAEPHIVKKQGRWQKGQDGTRAEAWKKDWRKYDWTRVLAEG